MAKKTTKKKTSRNSGEDRPEPQAPKMQTVSLPIKSIKKSSANPRTHTDKNAKAVDQSLVNHGQVEPILVQKSTYAIIHGHLRWQRMKKAGYEYADCALLDVDDDTALRMAVDLNRSGELAGWDESVLGEILSKARNDEFSVAGFSDAEINKIIDVGVQQEHAESGGDPSFDLDMDVFDDQQIEEAREKQEEKEQSKSEDEDEDEGGKDEDDEEETTSDSFVVIVELEDEDKQKELAQRLANEGYSVRRG